MYKEKRIATNRKKQMKINCRFKLIGFKILLIESIWLYLFLATGSLEVVADFLGFTLLEDVLRKRKHLIKTHVEHNLLVR